MLWNTRFGTLGRVPARFLLRSDNGLVFTSRHYTSLVRSYGLKGDWIQFYNHQRPHQALAMKTPAEAYALAV